MALIIPVASQNAISSQTVTLDNVTYKLTFTWNTRCETWYIDIGDHSGEAIVRGIKVSPAIEILGRHADLRLPGGKLWLMHILNNDLRPARFSLGVELQLLYLTKGEL